MPSANVLRGARVAGAPVALRACGPHGGPADPPVYGERALREACAAARAAGAAEGEARGRATTAAELQEAARAMSEMAGALIAERLQLLHQARRDLVRLALAMAQRLTRRALTLDEDAAMRALSEALQHAGQVESLVVRLHPEDAARLRAGAGTGPLLAPGRLEIRPAEDVGRGGCIVETPGLQIDGTVEGHLARMAGALAEWCDEEDLEDQGGAGAEVSDAA